MPSFEDCRIQQYIIKSTICKHKHIICYSKFFKAAENICQARKNIFLYIYIYIQLINVLLLAWLLKYFIVILVFIRIKQIRIHCREGNYLKQRLPALLSRSNIHIYTRSSITEKILIEARHSQRCTIKHLTYIHTLQPTTNSMAKAHFTRFLRIHLGNL